MQFPDRIDTTSASEPLPATPSGSSGGQVGASILLVDDEPALRGLVERVLTRAGHSVRVAGNGKEARAQFDRMQPPTELLICDLELPDVGGLELAREFKPKQPALAVLFISGRGGEDPLRAKLEAEGQKLLGKPFTSQALLEQVRMVLARL